jgi:hypothetical protein
MFPAFQSQKVFHLRIVILDEERDCRGERKDESYELPITSKEFEILAEIAEEIS